MPSSRTISANGIDIFVLEQGEGPLVVLCHGWPELAYSWRHQIPAMAAAGFHVVAPDMRGFGRTSAPADVGAYSIVDHVGDMVALVAALGEKQAAPWSVFSGNEDPPARQAKLNRARARPATRSARADRSAHRRRRP